MLILFFGVPYSSDGPIVSIVLGVPCYSDGIICPNPVLLMKAPTVQLLKAPPTPTPLHRQGRRRSGFRVEGLGLVGCSSEGAYQVCRGAIKLTMNPLALGLL